MSTERRPHPWRRADTDPEPTPPPVPDPELYDQGDDEPEGNDTPPALR